MVWRQILTLRYLILVLSDKNNLDNTCPKFKLYSQLSETRRSLTIRNNKLLVYYFIFHCDKIKNIERIIPERNLVETCIDILFYLWF